MTEHRANYIRDRLAALAKRADRECIDDPMHAVCIEYRRLLCEYWSVQRPAWTEQPDLTKQGRFRPRGTRAEHAHNTAQQIARRILT